MSTGDRKDHFGGFNFHIEIDGIAVGNFRHVGGLKTDTEIFEYQEGGDNDSVRRLVGQSKPSNLTLKKGLILHEGDLWKWRAEINGGDAAIKRRSGSVVLRGDDGSEKGRWNFHNAWPVRWEMSELDGNTNEVAVETIELAVERLERS